MIRKVTAEIASITGMQVKREVPFEVVSRDTWKQWVDDEIRRTVKPEEIRADETALKMLGLIPKDFDLKKATVDLLGEQAAAVYDHRRKKMMFVEGDVMGAMGEAVLVHELSHAVADQHFDMKRFLDKNAKTDESQSARLAVVEGQAMWVMLESQITRMGGQSLKNNRAALNTMMPAMGQMAADSYPVFSGAPLYLRETLIFPYTAGLLFQQAAIEKYGQAGFTSILKNPPSTTHQVLHPEQYFAGVAPSSPSLPDFGGRREYQKMSAGTLGELDIQILLRQYASEAEAKEVAPRWKGGAYELLEHKKDHQPLLRWAVEFDGPEAAQRFLKLYSRVLEGKSKTAKMKESGESRLAGESVEGEFRISADGTVVRGLEGMKRAL